MKTNRGLGLTDMNKSYRINRKIYNLFSDPFSGELVLIPQTDGDVVQDVNYSDYAYTHGGETYKLAVQKLKEIIAEKENN